MGVILSPYLKPQVVSAAINIKNLQKNIGYFPHNSNEGKIRQIMITD